MTKPGNDTGIRRFPCCAELVWSEAALMHEDNIIKRAFDLAEQCGSVDEVRRKLQLEGYFQVASHLSGRRIVADLRSRLNPEMRMHAKSSR